MNDFDVYRQWLGIPPDQRPPNHYELLGLDLSEDDAERIRAASLQRSAAVRRYCLGQHGAEATRLLGEIAAAFACLSDPAAKAAYDRQLTGGESSESDADAPPPVQRLLDWSDDDARDYSVKAGSGQTFVAPRSSLWLVRRRGTSSAGPARFSLAACLLLAAACGGVWSARYRPHANSRRPSVAGHASLAAAEDMQPPRLPRAELAPKPPASPPAKPLARAEAPPTLVADEEADGAAKSNDRIAPAGALPESIPQDQSRAAAELNASAAAGSESADGQARRPQPPANPDQAPQMAEATTPADSTSPAPVAATPPVALQPGILRKASAAPFSVAQVTGKEDMFFRDMKEDWGKAWQSERRGKPEGLELTFAAPVSPRFLRVFETPLPAQVDEVVLHPVSGPPQRLRPAKVGFDAANRRARTWSLGTSRPPTERIEITFLPTVEGFVEVDAVALLDQEGRLYYPVAARATSSAADDDPDLLNDDEPLAAQVDKAESPDETSSESLDKVDEVVAAAQLDEARQRQTVAAYATLLKDHPNTAAAVEAVRDLADIVAKAPPGEAYSARRAMERLVTRHPDSDAAKEVSGALDEARQRGPRPPPPANRRPPPGMPSRRGG
ncbi:MAG TPA: hypothetical protein VHB99_19750 [Pirellulales bacterium]|nr:hypothetical protein [Pirellulales bacterium]